MVCNSKGVVVPGPVTLTGEDYLSLSGQDITAHPVDLSNTNVTGLLPESSLSFTDITTNNVSTSKHGFTPKLSGSSVQFLNGEGNYVTPSGVAESYISQAFFSQTSVTVTHNFGVYPLVQYVDSDTTKYAISHEIVPLSVNAFRVDFSSVRSGTIIATLGSPPLRRQIDIDSDYTATLDDYGINVDTTSGDINIDLYTLLGNTTKELLIRKKVAANSLTITANGSDMVNGTPFITITSQYTVRIITAFSDEWGIT